VSENLVRDIHDLVATSEDPSEASARPPGTTRRELRAMRRDVLRKLRLSSGMSVAEIGCGVCLLGVPVARCASRYVGLDFAPQAVRVANERLRVAGVGDRARALCVDMLDVTDEELEQLGRFDRVLMYAVLHYARSEQEAMRLLQRTVDLLAPGGRALVGNVPLEDTATGWTSNGRSPRGPLARLILAGGWAASGGAALPLTFRWKTRRTVEAIVKAASLRAVGLRAASFEAASPKAASRQSPDAFPPVRLPANYTLALSTAAVERWLAMLKGDVTHRWQLPAPGVPLAPGRADLLILRR
jgi:cyclopropane fatty-acyl-phospholipid synthase-like methyltransferase